MQRAALSSLLERMGLTRVEAQVYLTLLEHGSQQAGIITKNAGIHRRTVYDAIARLIEKGLVSYIKANTVKLYQATHPERLLELVKERERDLASQMRELERLFEHQPDRHETVFFRGKKGLKTLFDDQLQLSGSTVLYLGATPAAVEQLRYYFPQFDRHRVERKIRVRLLFDQRAAGKRYVQRIPLAQARQLRVGHPQDVVTCIYGDTVSIISFGENPFGILIREKTVAMRYTDYFEILWKAGHLL